MSGPQLFTWFHHDNRPLSQWLQQRILRPLAEDLGEVTSADGVDKFLTELEERLDAVVPEPLVVRAISPKPLRVPGSSRPGTSPGSTLSTERWMFEVQMDGDLEMLDWWPDKVPVALMPVGLRLEDEPLWDERRGATLPAPRADDPDPAFARITRDTFLLTPAYHQPRDGTSRVYLTVESTADERRVHRDSGAFPRAMDARVNYFNTMREAINEQAVAFKEEARARVIQGAGVHRDRLDTDEVLLRSLSFDSSWMAQPLKLETVDAADRPAGHGDKTDGDDADGTSGIDIHDDAAEGSGKDLEATSAWTADMVTSTQPPAPRDLVAPVGQRLSSASFRDIQLIIAGWAQGVHAYAKTFHALDEDDLSCLLTATLKATTPGADHQVYRRAGKTDIVIRAEDLPDGYSDEPVFVCEAKKGGAGVAARALEEQLLSRYSTAQDTAAVLLLYLTNKNFVAARARALTSIRSIAGYRADPVQEALEDVSGWPILTFWRRGRPIRVCVATVDLYFEGATLAAAKRAEKGARVKKRAAKVAARKNATSAVRKSAADPIPAVAPDDNTPTP